MTLKILKIFLTIGWRSFTHFFASFWRISYAAAIVYTGQILQHMPAQQCHFWPRFYIVVLGIAFVLRQTYIFHILFGLLFSFSLWNFISLFYLDIFFSILFQLVFNSFLFFFICFSILFYSIAVTFWISSKFFSFFWSETYKIIDYFVCFHLNKKIRIRENMWCARYMTWE